MLWEPVQEKKVPGSKLHCDEILREALSSAYMVAIFTFTYLFPIKHVPIFWFIVWIGTFKNDPTCNTYNYWSKLDRWTAWTIARTTNKADYLRYMFAHYPFCFIIFRHFSRDGIFVQITHNRIHAENEGRDTLVHCNSSLFTFSEIEPFIWYYDRV